MSADSKPRQRKAATVRDGEAAAGRPVLQRTQPKVNQKIPSKTSSKSPPDVKKSQSREIIPVNKTPYSSIASENSLKTSAATNQFQASGKSKDEEGSVCASLQENAAGGLEHQASCSSAGSVTDQELPFEELRIRPAAEGRKSRPNPPLVTQRRKKAGKVAPEGIASPTLSKKRCGWITSQSDPTYVAHHDNEWGVPVHDDKLLFELLILSGVLAELSWPTILKKRHDFRAAFSGFDPRDIACFDEKNIASLRDQGILLEPKIRDIVDNAKRCMEVFHQYGSLDQYFWNFVNHKPICTKYRTSAQVPVKTPKSELMSKDLVKRGFRYVGPTIVYSFMQVTGMTNDHILQCFRHDECSKLAVHQLEESHQNDANSK